MLWPRKGSLMKTQTWILDNRLYQTRKIALHRKGKKSRTVQLTPILICLLWQGNLSVIAVHYSEMGKAPTSPLPQAFYFVKVLFMLFFSFWVDHQRVGEFPFSPFQVLIREDLNVENGVCNWFRCLLCVYLGPSTMYTISPIPRFQQDVLFWYF